MAGMQSYPIDVIARLLDLTPRRIRQLVDEGVIPRQERGRYELVPCVRAYVKYLRDRAVGGDVGSVDGGQNDKRRLLAARADIAEHEARRLAGSLVQVEHAERTWTSIATRVRQRMLGVAPKAAPLVAAETDPEACHEIIEACIVEGLAELAATRGIAMPGETEASDGFDIPRAGAAALADDIGVG